MALHSRVICYVYLRIEIASSISNTLNRITVAFMSEQQKARIISFDPQKQIGRLWTAESNGAYVVFAIKTGNARFAANDEVTLPTGLSVGQRVTVKRKGSNLHIASQLRKILSSGDTQIKIIDFAHEKKGEAGEIERNLLGGISNFTIASRLKRRIVRRPSSGYRKLLLKLSNTEKTGHLAQEKDGTEAIPHFGDIWNSIAKNIFSEKRDFLEWLLTPNESLQQEKPISLLVEGGDLDLLKQLLGRFEHGIMA
jgi:Protein of unknown function (DUF2384)